MLSAQPQPDEGGPLDLLAVIERLEVGPVRVEPQRLVAGYTVIAGRQAHDAELIYRYEEDVFQPGEPVSENLAALIAAQLALNYGLFCDEIVFRGAFDEFDRVFLAAAAENTAREIYVNKFLMPNPFLLGAAATLPAVKQERYLRARMSFPDAPPERRAGRSAASSGWSDDASRHAVLSSGGKDSLLTYGLLGELGRETHPIFVNESGRHWYTAINAFRHLAVTDPRTARVWSNCDRLFTWMLRRLPFVRPDFGRVRSDAYPIRLWTVAVFLFGALPLLRKRRVGRLLIGDEFDTTVPARHRGIPHHSGLYDQGRYFDAAMTRFFKQKGWGVLQFSLLRPLSELLVEKILVERYPELQRRQLSCHAAHLDGDRVLPCGRCEKCRRIVGMLEALGADPRRCGYDDVQIERALRALGEKGVHQESAGAEHMAWLLGQAGRLAEPAPGALRARAHPEVLQLRFDSRRSPLDAIPNDLREGLYRIYLQHASGSVKRQGRVWVAFDPLSVGSLSRPYPHADAARRVQPALDEPAAPPPRRPWLLGELSWPQARRRFKEVDVALLPVGAIEQHGPHLPLDTDAWDADYLAQRVAEACSEPQPLVLPPVAYGVSYHHEDFSGTLSVNPETLVQLVYEIGMSAVRHGIRKLVIVNGHGGNAAALHLAAQRINKDTHVFTCVDTGETSDADVAELVRGENDVHAGEIETSTSLAVRPDLVDMGAAPSAVPRFSSAFLDFTSKRGIGWYARTAKISRTGVLGDATRATREKGEKIWELMIRRLVELVEDLKRLSLDEIHQKRY